MRSLTLNKNVRPNVQKTIGHTTSSPLPRLYSCCLLYSKENKITSCLMVSFGKASIAARRVSSHALLTPVRYKKDCRYIHVISYSYFRKLLQVVTSINQALKWQLTWGWTHPRETAKGRSSGVKERCVSNMQMICNSLFHQCSRGAKTVLGCSNG